MLALLSPLPEDLVPVPVEPPSWTGLVFPARLKLRGRAAVPLLAGKGAAQPGCVSTGPLQVGKGAGLPASAVQRFPVCCSSATVHLLASIPLAVVKSFRGSASLKGGMPKMMMHCWPRCS